jgi:mono/diheme cytochrome c family protein
MVKDAAAWRWVGTGQRLLLGLGIVAMGACQPASAGSQREDAPGSEPAPVASEPYVLAGSEIEAGRYLVVVGGCNDCHTEGYLQTEGNVPEEAWLGGSMLGWRGPWGTTYPSNLRLRAQEWTEEAWVQTLRERKTLPPMPWMNVNQMSDGDARAMYRYIRSLGALGSHAPLPVPPDQEPSTPYLSLMPVEPMR